MAERINCKYSKDCAKEGCILIHQVDHQSRNGGSKTREEAGQIKQNTEPGPYWLDTAWGQYIINVEIHAPKLGCGQIRPLHNALLIISSQKMERDELV
jgi:hypothetical protein